MAKALARNLNYRYIDSGAMYRSVTLYALEHNMIKDEQIDLDALKEALHDIHIDFGRDENGNAITLLNNKNVEAEIRGPQVSGWVSPISTIAFVRAFITEMLQQYGKEKGIVMDGRDIGTTVFPNAELKIFVTARPEVRAQRRFEEMQQKGNSMTYEEVLHNLSERDRIDSSREVSPLAKAHDAIDFDNSDLTIEQQDAQLLQMAREVIARS